MVAWYEAAFSPGPAKRSVKNGVAEASDEPCCRLTRSVTVTGATEAAPSGTSTVSWVAVAAVTVARTAPNVTASRPAVAEKPVPLMTTGAPAAAAAGARPVTTGWAPAAPASSAPAPNTPKKAEIRVLYVMARSEKASLKWKQQALRM